MPRGINKRIHVFSYKRISLCNKVKNAYNAGQDEYIIEACEKPEGMKSKKFFVYKGLYL